MEIILNGVLNKDLSEKLPVVIDFAPKSFNYFFTLGIIPNLQEPPGYLVLLVGIFLCLNNIYKIFNKSSILPSSENTDGVKIIPQREKTLWRRGYNWFCGFEDETSGSAMMKAKEMAQRLQKITNLEQNPKIKLFLNVNLGFIICIATVLYVYFTFFTYTLDH